MNFRQSDQPPYFNCVDKYLYSECESWSTKLLNTDPVLDPDPQHCYPHYSSDFLFKQVDRVGKFVEVRGTAIFIVRASTMHLNTLYQFFCSSKIINTPCLPLSNDRYLTHKHNIKQIRSISTGNSLLQPTATYQALSPLLSWSAVPLYSPPWSPYKKIINVQN